MQVVSLQEAKDKKLTHYFTGKPCVRGHLAPRFTSIRKCKECAREDAAAAHTPKSDRKVQIRDTLSFVAACQKTHGGAYDYSAAVWQGAKAPVEIICKAHGSFWQKSDNHKAGKGCPKCRDARTGLRCLTTKDQFVAKAQAFWGEAYSFEEAVYKGSHTKVVVICHEHSIRFTQTPTNLLSGKGGCPKCNHMASAPEEAVADLMALFTSVERRDRSLLKPYELDIVLPEKSLAIEYCGEYFHSSGDQESEVKMATKHIAKHKACAEKGIRLITVFESEWKNHNYAVRRLLRNAVGAGRGKVMARKCELRPVEHPEAVAFYDRYHPQGGAGYGAHYGLFWKGKLVACMRFTEGANDRGANKSRTWTLSRYATRVTVTGGASRLFKAFVEDKNPKTVKSFSDNRFFSGGVYEQLGFELVEDSAADYQVWHKKLGLKPKTHWQRREIQSRAKDLGIDLDFDHETDPRTERDMTYLLGGRRIYDCGKKKWVWTKGKTPDRLEAPKHPFS